MLYKTILIPVDDSEISTLALNHGIRLAHDLHAKVIILNIIDEESYLGGETYFDMESLEAEITKQSKALLDKAAVLAQHSGVEVSTQTVILKPLERGLGHKIVEAANTLSVDLIVIGSHFREGIERLFLGNVAAEIMSSAKIPVLLIRGS